MERQPELISIVISFRNEEESLPELIARIDHVFTEISEVYELIFVNDASDDDSLKILRDQQKNNRSIKIINMSRTFGITPCVFAGFRHTRGEATIYMDADLQDPPELIPQLIKCWRDGYDVVHTKRIHRFGENRLKMVITRLAYRVIDLFSDMPIPTNAGDFKLLSARVVTLILEIKEYDPFLRGLSLWVGFRQTFVPYQRQMRHAGETKHSLFRSTNPYAELIRGITNFSLAPLYISLFLGMLVSLGSFLYLILILAQRILFGLHLPGWPALMVSLLFLGGAILFSIGILGIYIGRIYAEVRKRPRYIIESTEGFQ